jgi:prophage regulatory protein
MCWVEGTSIMLEPEKFYRIHEVKALIGYAEATIYQMVSRGEFPRPVNIGKRAVAWRAHDLVAWQQSRQLTKPGVFGIQPAPRGWPSEAKS